MLLFSQHLGGWMIKTQQLCLSERIGNLQCRPVEHSENNTRANSYGVAPTDNLPGVEITKKKVFMLWKMEDHKRPNTAKPLL